MNSVDAATHVRHVLAARHALDALPHDALDDARAILDELGVASPDERAVLRIVADGLHTGRARYGPLCLASDPRNMAAEALEEARDCAVYLAAALVRLLPLLDHVQHWP